MGKEQPWSPCGLLLLLGPDLSYPSSTAAVSEKNMNELHAVHPRRRSSSRTSPKGEDPPIGSQPLVALGQPIIPSGNVGSRGQRRGGMAWLAGTCRATRQSSAPGGNRLQAAKQHLKESREAQQS